MNGGFDVLCGRMVYYDGAFAARPRTLAPTTQPVHPFLCAEVINDFGSNDSNRIECAQTHSNLAQCTLVSLLSLCLHRRFEDDHDVRRTSQSIPSRDA